MFFIIPLFRGEFTLELEIQQLVYMYRNRILVKGNEMLSPKRLGMQGGHPIINQNYCLLYSCYVMYMTKFLGWFYYKILFFFCHLLNIILFHLQCSKK